MRVTRYKFVDNCQPYQLNLPRGEYFVEGWGGCGGSSNPIENSGGTGAYVAAKLCLKTMQTLFVFVGGKGQNSSDYSEERFLGGCNGGGSGGIGHSSHSNGSGGGGATDIRVNDTFDGRIFVAAGGGGDSGQQINKGRVFRGGYGGAPDGGIAEHSTNFEKQAEIPASYDAGYEMGKGQDGRDGVNQDGAREGNGGAGGGYYGGYSSRDTRMNSCAGGNGGSSFVSTEYFTNITMKAGNETFTYPRDSDGGNGLIIITQLTLETSNVNLLFFRHFCFSNIINLMLS